MRGYRKFADLELTYRGESPNPPAARFGTYLGDGDGVIEGDSIAGDVSWSLFENQSPGLCDANMVGQIRRADGSLIPFEIVGFFRRQSDSDIWQLNAAIKFGEAGASLPHPQTGLLAGTFDMASYVHRYEIFAPDTDC